MGTLRRAEYEISFRDFNQHVAKRASSQPQQDSPGDTAEDEMTETWIGKDGIDVERTPAEEVEVLADSPAESEEPEEQADDEQVRAVSSDRPDPIQDLNRPSSTH